MSPPVDARLSVISAAVDDIVSYFELLENPWRMVVLGDPGAGKTVVAACLVRGHTEWPFADD